MVALRADFALNFFFAMPFAMRRENVRLSSSRA